ncbi:MAG: hypothetical protein ACKOWF_14270 [Chloroflexota bacterium]
MDRSQFDTLARALARTGSRRAALALLLGGAAASGAREAAACIKTDKRCRVRKRNRCNLCCSYYTDGVYCRCKPENKACGNDFECCSNLCSFTNNKGRCAAG